MVVILRRSNWKYLKPWNIFVYCSAFLTRPLEDANVENLLTALLLLSVVFSLKLCFLRSLMAMIYIVMSFLPRYSLNNEPTQHPKPYCFMDWRTGRSIQPPVSGTNVGLLCPKCFKVFYNQCYWPVKLQKNFFLDLHKRHIWSGHKGNPEILRVVLFLLKMANFCF